MYKNSSAKYYRHKKKERLQKKTRERHKSCSDKEKERESNNIGGNNIKISQKMKNKSWLSIEKNIAK